jgi:integrase
MPRHTTMPQRIQKTPHGDVTLTSRWMRDRYLIVAAGPLSALSWMLPKSAGSMEKISSQTYRHAFVPAPTAITVERDLRRVCAAWQAKWDERLADHREGLPAVAAAPPRPETLKQAFEHHQAHYARLLGQRTNEQYPVRMAEWFTYLGADAPLEEITAEAIMAARQEMAKKGSSNNTINGKVSTLKKILNMAHRKGWVSRATWRDVPNLRVIRQATTYWTAEEAALAFKSAAEDERVSRAILMLTLGIHLGLRKNEAIHLRWMDIIFDRLNPQTGNPSPIAIIQQREGFTTKTYENRKIPLSAEAVRLLQEHRPKDARPEDYVLDPERHHRKRGGTKRVYRYDCVKLWGRVLKRAMALGAKRIEFKEMRHSFACNCLLKGHGVEKVARWLGHKDPRMVRQHYAHLLDYDDDTGLRFLDDGI